jgi:hypothetical protein
VVKLVPKEKSLSSEHDRACAAQAQWNSAKRRRKVGARHARAGPRRPQPKPMMTSNMIG